MAHWREVKEVFVATLGLRLTVTLVPAPGCKSRAYAGPCWLPAPSCRPTEGFLARLKALGFSFHPVFQNPFPEDTFASWLREQRPSGERNCVPHPYSCPLSPAEDICLYSQLDCVSGVINRDLPGLGQPSFPLSSHFGYCMFVHLLFTTLWPCPAAPFLLTFPLEPPSSLSLISLQNMTIFL